MSKGEMVYEGKAKRMFLTDDPGRLVVEYKDSLTAFNAQKVASMEGKGRLNNVISSVIFQYLKDRGVDNHFVRVIDDTHQEVLRVTILPIEVVVRNITAGSICKRLGVKEGLPLPRPLVELYYKDDALGDPIITEDHAVLFGWATQEELDQVKSMALKVNQLLGEMFEQVGVTLVDFKLEFGRTKDGRIILADEISPDTCRLWDKATNDRLDKDRFRNDLGRVLEAYEEIWKRLSEPKEA
ncbi:phosphoribosylaminoimidazole-succinocarboxamides ynthase [Thermanaerovibrio acidaminovorans DSM 6589]|uniref:Phosphoribosylaminoimidazole-succinocarboxamide synthase n=1 Tax=Thermanaerovibrio acidaminovorans (strain ATCC 49978 / DSM 6589 / Su883) TaxID=525903 RepID=D1B9P4_THEAS|nr:phosphoribosylaminoimidazolesuccinocarboxamide synthase [Thermanaerovibrio acidaminovorans]ACZ18997.1 phosphoribosylaminoimidazole-succinocarboxamides ynthase [Thermanaerovibrio acidaminovorans DSM 6589]